jgi:hypothetical protein
LIFCGSGLDVDFQFFRKPMRIKWAARKISAFDFNRGNLPPSVVRAQHDLFCVRRLVNIHFAESDSPLPQEPLHPPAIRTPHRAIDRNFGHFDLFTLRILGKNRFIFPRFDAGEKGLDSERRRAVNPVAPLDNPLISARLLLCRT